MSLFGGKKVQKEPVFDGLLGVDIGTQSIKIVELTKEQGKPRLTTYGYAERNDTASAGAFLSERAQTAEIIKDICKNAGIRAKKAVASLPASEVFHTIISIPTSTQVAEDTQSLIEAQARKVLPLPLEEMVLDSVVLKNFHEQNEEKQGKEKFTQVFLTGAPKTLIQQYLEIFGKAGIELVSLETEVMAVARALVGEEEVRAMVVDMGSERTNVLIVDRGIPLLTRGIKAGGLSITKALSASMGIPESEAEMTKRDLGFGTEMLPKPLQDALQPVVHEMRYALQLYAGQAFHEHQDVEKILLTGGSAHLPGLCAFLTEALQVNVYVGDPWARIATVPEARPLLEEIGPRFAVSAGLALRI